jgi:hypothetical protein
MANKMHAIVKYGPRVVPGPPAHDDDAIDYMTRNTGMSKGECRQAIANFVDMLQYFLKQGRSVHLDDFGSLAADIGLDGDFNLNYRPDQDLKQAIKTDFRGVLENSENIGKKLPDLIALWNADPANADNQIPTT